MRCVVWVVPSQLDGTRLDQALASEVGSRRLARRVIDGGGVYVDGVRTRVQGRAIRAGQRIEAWVETGHDGERKAVPSPVFTVVGEDHDIVVVDKPSGVFAAPTRQSCRDNLQAMLESAGRRVWLVHRIDRETSGLMVFATSLQAARQLNEAFREHTIDREYLAALVGRPSSIEFTIATNIASQRAVTHLEVIEQITSSTCLVRCRLETGRTHQIRIHCASVGHPVLGDRRYGTATAHDPPRLALHAHRLGFSHPRHGEHIEFTSPWPKDLREWVERVRSSQSIRSGSEP